MENKERKKLEKVSMRVPRKGSISRSRMIHTELKLYRILATFCKRGRGCKAFRCKPILNASLFFSKYMLAAFFKLVITSVTANWNAIWNNPQIHRLGIMSKEGSPRILGNHWSTRKRLKWCSISPSSETTRSDSALCSSSSETQILPIIPTKTLVLTHVTEAIGIPLTVSLPYTLHTSLRAVWQSPHTLKYLYTCIAAPMGLLISPNATANFSLW